MRKIKLQSYSDVVTNSSSEIFVVRDDNDNFIEELLELSKRDDKTFFVDTIDMDYIKKDYDYQDVLCHVAGVEMPDDTRFIPTDEWIELIEKNRDSFESIVGMAIVGDDYICDEVCKDDPHVVYTPDGLY